MTLEKLSCKNETCELFEEVVCGIIQNGIPPQCNVCDRCLTHIQHDKTEQGKGLSSSPKTQLSSSSLYTFYVICPTQINEKEQKCVQRYNLSDLFNLSKMFTPALNIMVIVL